MEKPVTLISQGEQMVGMLHLPENGPFPAVAIYHGFTGTKVEPHRILSRCRALAREGVAAVRFDFRALETVKATLPT